MNRSQFFSLIRGGVRKNFCVTDENGRKLCQVSNKIILLLNGLLG